MGLDSGDLETVPAAISRRECYERIRSWLTMDGHQAISDDRRESEGAQLYFAVIAALPVPEEMTEEDLDWVFGQVLSWSLEWAYHRRDSNGVKMAAYAHFAINKKYDGFKDEAFQSSRRRSALMRLIE